jgi:hypothetical protein
MSVAILQLLLAAPRGGGALQAAPAGGTAARAASSQRIISTAAAVKIGAKTVSEDYDDECYVKYFACMDQFCVSENESGGRCVCSSTYDLYEGKMKTIEKNADEASRISSIEVEKVGAGGKFTSSIPGGTMETSALFNRETRNCHITRVSRSRACKQSKKNGFFGIGGSASNECGEEKVVTTTEDIPL